MTITTQRLPRAAQPISEGHLSVAQVCAELGVARSTFYDWRAAHKGPHALKLPNGEIRIRRADLDAWLHTLEERA